MTLHIPPINQLILLRINIRPPHPPRRKQILNLTPREFNSVGGTSDPVEGAVEEVEEGEEGATDSESQGGGEEGEEGGEGKEEGLDGSGVGGCSWG